MTLPKEFIDTIGKWQERLLQLDRRNSLLYFKPESRSVLLMEERTSDEMTKLLDSKGVRGTSFDYTAPRRRHSLRMSPESGHETDENVIRGDLRSDCPALELQRRLGNLKRRQDEWESEQGLPVLYLALGLLDWVDEDGERAISPLLLFPCKLVRANPRSEFRLSATEEDPISNETLSVKLSEFGIELPQVGEESASDYFSMVRKSIAMRAEWKVEDKVFLGAFAYSKLAMWRDLGTLRDSGTRNEVIRVLSGFSQQIQKPEIPLIKRLITEDDNLSGGKLDDLLTIKDQYAVLPTDYSQLKAVALADQGANLVIHGPPGTGKSQTIANIIATFIAKGKTVLFVSEKKAALDVVKKRLDDVELGIFCLDMHSERGRKANVYQQLRESVDDRRSVRIIDRQLASRGKQRQDLNEYVRSLHKVRQPLGQSVYEVQGRYAELIGFPDVDIDIPSIGEINRDQLAQMQSVLDRIAGRWREFKEHHSSSWVILRTKMPSLGLADIIRTDMANIESAAMKLATSMSGVAACLGLPAPEGLNDVARLEKVIEHLSCAPGVPDSWRSEDAIGDIRRQARQESEVQARRKWLIDRLSNRGLIDAGKHTLSKLTALEDALFREYDEEILDVVDQSMLVRYRTDHQNWWKRIFSSSFRQDQRTLRSFRKTALKLSLQDGLSLVRLVLAVKDSQQEWESLSHKLQSRVGSKFTGRYANWESIDAELLSAEAELEEIESREAKSRARLEERFGELYDGFDTDWERVDGALQWTKDLLTIVGTPEIMGKFAIPATAPADNVLMDELSMKLGAARQEFNDVAHPLGNRYNFDCAPWHSWFSIRFKDIANHATLLRDDADSASAWVDYRNRVAEVEKFLGIGAVGKCREVTGQAKEVPSIVMRRVFKTWLDSIYAKTSALRMFAAVDHERVRDNFHELDRKLGFALRSAIRRNGFERYAGLANSYGMGILQDQLSKKRRQLPVRRLLERASSAIQGLKMCFLMSPLAVSQYLPLGATSSDTLTFDAVIFDEASQVFPEDAIPAILHGKQVILAGDRRQLPPTKFWRRSLSDDNDEDYDDEEDDIDSLEDRESILDVGIGRVGGIFTESHLETHYRSRHEDLIRFSNRHFYEDRLLTFPSPATHGGSSGQGVYNHFMSDGTFEAGGSRTNEVEAEKVTALVFEHMRTHGKDKTLGVAAFSRPQADLIDRLITERRILEGDLEYAFSEDGANEPFFVKNLENVQGDERDRIIISVGYGPPVAGGTTPNRFGPLNQENGERRLNVLVTRARERMDVIHSLKPSDIHSGTTGARLLRRFLEYARNPAASLSDGPTTTLASPTGEELNDFEKAVKSALEARGHRVVGQVGSAGYRIDLAILSEDGERYDLGVECDGATYHSAPAARDRDWLRQSVLEDLGWTIHRVWSRSWVQDPKRETDRIEDALRIARLPKTITSRESSGSGLGNEPVYAHGEEAIRTEIVNPIVELELDPYEESNLSAYRIAGPLRFENTEILMNLAVRVVLMEGPVHGEMVVARIRERYGMSYVNKKARERVEMAIDQCVKKRWIIRDGDILYMSSEQLNRQPRKLGSRRLEFMPPSELASIVVSVAERFLGPKDMLIVQVARLLGFSRTGSRIKEIVGKSIQDLLNDGRLELSSGIVQPSR